MLVGSAWNSRKQFRKMFPMHQIHFISLKMITIPHYIYRRILILLTVKLRWVILHNLGTPRPSISLHYWLKKAGCKWRILQVLVKYRPNVGGWLRCRPIINKQTDQHYQPICQSTCQPTVGQLLGSQHIDRHWANWCRLTYWLIVGWHVNL